MGETHHLPAAVGAVGDVVAGETRHRSENPAVERAASVGQRSQNLPEEQLPLAALYHEGHVEALLRKERDCPGAPCHHGHRLERGVVLTDGIPSAYNRWDQMALSFAAAPCAVAPCVAAPCGVDPCGAAVVPCGAVPCPAGTGEGTGCAEGPAADERVVAGRKRSDEGCRMAVPLPCDLASAYKEASEKVRQR